MPGATTAEVTVYDTAKKVDGLSQTVEVDRFQTDGDQLQVIALFAITERIESAAHAGCRPDVRVRAASGRDARLRNGEVSGRATAQHAAHRDGAEGALRIQLSRCGRARRSSR